MEIDSEITQSAEVDDVQFPDTQPELHDSKENESQPISDESQAPPKPPRSGFMMFASEERVKLKDSGLAVGEVSKKIGALWHQLSEEQRKEYSDKVKRLRTAYKEYLDAHPSLQAAAQSSKAKDSNALYQYPVARIKKLIDCDKDIQRTSKESTVLITRCAELFVQQLASHAIQNATRSGRKTISGDHVMSAIHDMKPYLFLRHAFPQHSTQASLHMSSKKPRAKTSKKSAPDIANQNTITNFFRQ